MNDESNHAISTIDDPIKEEELDDDGKDLDGSSAMLNDTGTDDVTKGLSVIDASSTNEDDDSGKLKLYEKLCSAIAVFFILFLFFCVILTPNSDYFSFTSFCVCRGRCRCRFIQFDNMLLW